MSGAAHDVDGRLWSSTEACALAGISYRRLDYWIRCGVITPAAATIGTTLCRADTSTPGSGRRRHFTTAQVEMLRACAQHAGGRANVERLAELVAGWADDTAPPRAETAPAGAPTCVRAVIIETGPGRWRAGVRLPNGADAYRECTGRLVDVDAAVDELLEVIADEWPAVATLDDAAIDWWIADVLDDLEVHPAAARPDHGLTYLHHGP